jgi:hypothetical protein
MMRKLEWDGWPRLQMLLIVLLTGGAGLLCSFALLHAGMDSMAVRYPLSVGGAYLAFLVLLWLWLRTSASDYIDAAQIDLPLPGGGPREPVFAGGGGHSGGGGASGSFAVDEPLPSPGLPQVDLPDGSSVGEAVGGAVGSADEGAVPLVIVLVVAVVVAALFFATLYIVYLAPALFAELLVDGVLSASLYRRLRGLQTRHWLESAIRRTVIPFSVTAVTLAIAGYGLACYAPGARTLADAWQQHHATAPR